MNSPVESLLEDDHASLGQLLSELDAELAKLNVASAFELLDLFWARLAIHIRAEHLHLFPAVANAPAVLFTGSGGFPTSEEVHDAIARLRADHDFFMKDLAQMMKTMREFAGSPKEHLEEIEDLRRRLTTIATRLEAHNQLEEMEVYRWPKLILNEQELAALDAQIAHEIESLPPRLIL
jgi:hypothetical protein